MNQKSGTKVKNAIIGMTNKQNAVIYLGEFDLRHENAQALLVKNNAKILNRLGYNVAFIGVNRASTNEEIACSPKLDVGEENMFLELENTLTIGGILKYRETVRKIMSFMDMVADSYNVKYVISYQSPTYAVILKKICSWCKDREAKYIVNCADITIFNSQPILRRIVMTMNWKYLHKINKANADGLIAVSSYIKEFYHKEGMPEVIIPPLFDDYYEGDYELADKVTFIYAGSPFVLKKNVNTAGMKDRLDKIVDLCIRLSGDNIKYRLLIVGITKEVYLTCIPKHRQDLEKNCDILFLGRCSHKETLEAVRNADYMLNIRDINIMNVAGLSTKLVESVSLGTPVAMNSVGDNFNYLQNGITGFELSGELDEDIVLIESLCEKTIDERIALKKKCADIKTFSIDRYEDKLEQFLFAVSNS